MLRSIFRKNKPSRIAIQYFLSSYPKSGSTWVRWQLALILKDFWEEDKLAVNWNTIDYFVPGVDSGENMSLEYVKKDYPLITKTHKSYDDSMRKIIVVYRNPSESLLSYRNYLDNYGIKFKSNMEFLKSNRYGVKAWSKFHDSYLDAYAPGVSLLFIDYFDLTIDSAKVMKRVTEFLGILDVDVNDVMNKSSKSVMLSHESLSRSQLEINRKFSFVTQEKTFKFSKKELEYVKEMTGSTWERLEHLKLP